MPTRSLPASLASAIATLACLSSLHAEVISLNFVRNDGTGEMAPADQAGAVAAINWNTATAANADVEAVGIPLVDGAGAATTATATWATGGASWSVPLDGAGAAGDLLMMTGYLDQGGDGNGQIHTVTITGIPYPNYDVYLYHSSAGGPNRTARYNANRVDIFTRNLDPAGVFDEFLVAGYATLAEAADLANPAGNFVLWEGLGSATLNIEAQGLGSADGGAGGDTRRAPIQGIQIVERSPGLPTVENLPATAVSVETATANGSLINNGAGDDRAELTIYWGTTDGGIDPMAWDDSSSAGSLLAPGEFNVLLSGLSGNTIYYYRAFASNSAGDDWAPFSESFTTLPDPVFPEVENRPATAVGLDSATANGELLNNGSGADQSDITIYWGTADGGTDKLAWENNISAGSLTSPGVFNVGLTGLSQNTLYYYRAHATNSAGEDWAPGSESFATLRPQVDAISLNFIRASSGATPLLLTDVAGVVPASNWNNATTTNANAEPTGIVLNNDSGVATTAVATWQTGGASWSVATAGAGGAADMKMMTGYLDQSGDGNGQIHMISVTDIPFGTYDVYLYHSSSGGPNRSARYNANGTDLFTRNLDPANAFDGFVNAQYETLAEAALNGGNPAGNYVVWEGLTGDLTIEAQGLGDADGGSGGNTRRAPVQGIQIVAAGPPTRFEITSIVYQPSEDLVTLTFNSEPGGQYAIDASVSLDAEGAPGGWFELDDFEATEASSTYEDSLPDPAPPRRYYRIRQL